MSVIDWLSSATGDPAEASNKVVETVALTDPKILDEVAGCLECAGSKLLGDCVEVFTEVAKQKPELVAPYAPWLIPLLQHNDTRVRWEATHAIALVASLVPDRIEPLLPDLAHKIDHDRSVIVRDSAVKALGEYGHSGPQAARQVFPLLARALEAWEGKHARLAVKRLDTGRQNSYNDHQQQAIA